MDLLLHIGAHRTGTTAMQDMLAANRAVLEAAGISALVHADLEREVRGFARIPRREGWDGIRARLDAATEGAAQVLISDENMIGDMGWNIRSGSFYWRAKKKLEAYRDFFAADPRRIGLGIRSYESYWISAHAIELTYRDVTKDGVVRFDEARAGMAGALRGWRDLVADIRAVFPASEILVWPVEAALPVGRIMARLTGMDLPLTPPPQKVNAAPDARLIPAMEDKRAAEPGLRRAAMWDWLKTQAPRPFAGFDEDQRAHMAERYAADLAALEQGFAGAELLAHVEPGAA
ncbi:hypothetical protein [Sinisalibacter aestuarii]|uniref:Sulfotransferase family protein n=1 Tax=Sinisalibacter aestuarii TaxID=2949426 RepID=A0ABQ5LTP9_9RHOB|nr:hypothetical protein [Sinisalibacter aestuarii]GKY88343.1 hypothetical protein STA1M1_22120 [Sinisalibacter aestuarii]